MSHPSSSLVAELAGMRTQVGELAQTLWAAHDGAELMDVVAEVEALKSSLDGLELPVVRAPAVGVAAPRGRAERTGGIPNCSASASGRAPASIVYRPETACAGAIRSTARGKTMDRIIEVESGTYAPRSVHPHNGYYAGDFSSAPFKQPDLSALLRLQFTPPETR